MKAHLHHLALALLAIIIDSPGQAQTIFGTEYPVGLNAVSWVRGVGLAAGGLMVSARPMDSTASSGASSILTTDEVGAVVTLLQYEHGSSDMITCMERMSSGDIIVGSSSRDHFAPSSDMLIKRLDLQGNVIWCKAMRPFVAPSDLFDLVEPIPGVLIGLGYVENGMGQPLVFRFDDMGNVAWSRQLVPSVGRMKCMYIAADPAGGVIVSGGYVDTLNESKMVVIHLDMDGNVDWAHSYGTGNDNEVLSTLVDPNGGLAIVGRFGIIGSPGNLQNSGGVIRTDASGAPYSMFRWGVEPKGGHCFADGSLLLYVGVPVWKTGFIRIDATNTIQWSAILEATTWGEVVPLYGSSRFAYVSSKIYSDITINTLTDQLQACDGDTVFNTSIVPTWENHAPLAVSAVPMPLNSVDVPITIVPLNTSIVVQCEEFVGVPEQGKPVVPKLECSQVGAEHVLSISGLYPSAPSIFLSDILGRRWPVQRSEITLDRSKNVQLELPYDLAPGIYVATAGSQACTFLLSAR